MGLHYDISHMLKLIEQMFFDPLFPTLSLIFNELSSLVYRKSLKFVKTK